MVLRLNYRLFDYIKYKYVSFYVVHILGQSMEDKASKILQ